MRPSSALRPFGHHPAQGIPNACAMSRAAWSTPVWPPETIFSTGCFIGPQHDATMHSMMGKAYWRIIQDEIEAKG